MEQVGTVSPAPLPSNTEQQISQGAEQQSKQVENANSTLENVNPALPFDEHPRTLVNPPLPGDAFQWTTAPPPAYDKGYVVGVGLESMLVNPPGPVLVDNIETNARASKQIPFRLDSFQRPKNGSALPL